MKIKEKILDEYKKGNIVFASFGELMTAPINDFIDQPIEGLLYDLNRSEEVVLAFIDNPKWVNDYAVCKVIRALKDRVSELENELKKTSNELYEN